MQGLGSLLSDVSPKLKIKGSQIVQFGEPTSCLVSVADVDDFAGFDLVEGRNTGRKELTEVI
jgi:hypothetical protein